MTLTRSHKIRLLPNKEQEQWLRMVAGSARYAYNQMLNRAINDYENFKKNGGKKPSTSFYSIRKTFRDNRDVLMPWWKEVPERAYSNEAAHLSRGFSNFYQRLKTGGASGFPKFRRQITHKAEAQQSNLILVDRWFPSSKMCGKCGVKNEKLLLSQRSWTCGSCGKRLNRDLNAARNIMEYSEEKWLSSSSTSEYFNKIHHTGGSSEIHACGEAEVDASMKQEPTLNARMSINGHD